MVFPTHARVVVIGGGIAGCSIAYRLAELGWQDIVLVERNVLSSGTTWHAAGDLLPMRYAPEEIEFVQDSIEMYRRLSAETGQNIGWKACGTLVVCESNNRRVQQERITAYWNSLGGQADMVSPDDIARLNPFVRIDDLICGMYSPEAYRVNPADVTQAIAKAARHKGVKIFENTKVTGFDFVERGAMKAVSSVVTNKGRIACDSFVISSGAWSHQLGKMARINIPLYAVEHSYLVSEKVEGATDTLPITRNPDSWSYSREEVGGFLIGFFEPGAKPLAVDKLPDDMTFENLPEDWEHFGQYIEQAIHRYPFLEETGIKLLFTGPESFTPDVRLMMGEAPDIKNAFVFAGFNSSGIMLSGGAAKALAEWMDQGEPQVDISHIDIRRFPSVCNDTEWLARRVTEIPSKVLKVHLPHDDFETGRKLLTTPYYDRLKAYGARFGQSTGWEQPNWFRLPIHGVDETLVYGYPGWTSVVAEEHQAARESAALNTSTLFGLLDVGGSGALELLQTIFCNNIDVELNRIVYTGMLNSKGGFEADLTVTRLGEDRFIVVSGMSHIDRDHDRIRRISLNFDGVEIENLTPNTSSLAINGPYSRKLLSCLTDTPLDDDAFPYLSAREITIHGTDVLAYRISFAGECGWELYMPTSCALDIYDALVRTGADFGLRHMGAYAADSLRLEKGFRAWGRDISPIETPYEADLGFVVRLKKDVPFIGRDALLKQIDAGITKMLVSFTFDDADALPHGNEPIWRDGKTVGFVTSGGLGHSIGKPIAMGYVSNPDGVNDAFILDGSYEIQIGAARFVATPHLKPLYDPTGEKVHGINTSPVLAGISAV